MNRYIDSEIILSRRIGYFVYIYILLIIIVILSLITMSMLFNYKLYYKVKSVILNDSDGYYLCVYIPLDDNRYITSNEYVIIDNVKYKYSIKYIDSEYITDNVNTYQVISLNINLPSKYCYSNLMLEVKFIKEDKRIIDYLFRK